MISTLRYPSGQVLDGQQDSMALAASRDQISGGQRSLHNFLRPTQAQPDQAPPAAAAAGPSGRDAPADAPPTGECTDHPLR